MSKYSDCFTDSLPQYVSVCQTPIVISPISYFFSFDTNVTDNKCFCSTSNCQILLFFADMYLCRCIRFSPGSKYILLIGAIYGNPT